MADGVASGSCLMAGFGIISGTKLLGSAGRMFIHSHYPKNILKNTHVMQYEAQIQKMTLTVQLAIRDTQNILWS
jgi:hypothetical protein